MGYGHLISTDKSADPGGAITQAEAERLFLIDLAKAGRALARLVKVPLTVWQAAALLSFVFNLGGGKLQISTLRSLVNQRRYEEAADEFPKWRLVGGVPSRGILHRRLAERALFLGITRYR